MIFIPRTIDSVERYTRPALPPAPSYTGDTIAIEFQYLKSNNKGPNRITTIHTASFVKHIYFDRKTSKLTWCWAYDGVKR